MPAFCRANYLTKTTMKNFLIVLLVIIAFIWAGLKYHAHYKESHVMSNEIVFEMYTNMTEEETEDFFKMKRGTYNKEEHELLCEFYVKNPGLGGAVQHVQMNAENANCKESYDRSKFTKYEIEPGLPWNMAKLFIVRRSGFPTALFSEGLNSGGIAASRVVGLPCKKANINHLLITKNGIYGACK